MSEQPPLKFIHSETSLISLKLAQFDKLTTEASKKSLAPGQTHCLKTRTDGTVLDGHHRVHVLRRRGVDIDNLPREIIEPAESG